MNLSPAESGTRVLLDDGTGSYPHDVTAFVRQVGEAPDPEM